jgi:hypothetical protein
VSLVKTKIGRLEKSETKKRNHVKVEAEIGVIQTQAMNFWTTSSWKKQKGVCEWPNGIFYGTFLSI